MAVNPVTGVDCYDCSLPSCENCELQPRLMGVDWGSREAQVLTFLRQRIKVPEGMQIVMTSTPQPPNSYTAKMFDKMIEKNELRFKTNKYFQKKIDNLKTQ